MASPEARLDTQQAQDTDVSQSPNEKTERVVPVANTESSSQYSLHGINEKALIRKLDYKLLPTLTFLYLLSFLDRSNVGNARIEGLATDLDITGNQYLTSLTLFW